MIQQQIHPDRYITLRCDLHLADDLTVTQYLVHLYDGQMRHLASRRTYTQWGARRWAHRWAPAAPAESRPDAVYRF